MTNAPSIFVLVRLLGAFLFVFSACSDRGSSSSDKSKAQAASSAKDKTSSPELATFALAYQPQASEVKISRTQKEVRENPKDAGKYRDLAEAFLVRKRETADAKFFALAKDAMAAARMLSPDDLDIRTSAVQLLFNDHQFAEAAAETRKIIAANSNNATAHLLLADALLEQGDYDGSVEALESAMDISPDLRVFARASYLRWLDGDLEGAIEMIDDAIAMGSATKEAVSWCLVELGMLHWHAGELDKAEAAAAKSHKLVPDYPAATELQARVESSRGNSAAAIALYQALVQRRPTVAAHIALSEELKNAGDGAAAQAQRKKAEAMAVHDPLALALHDARHALTPKETHKLAMKALTERSNIYTQDAHALSLLRVNEIEAASKASPSLEEFGGLDSSLWLHKGLIQAASGQSTEAKASLDKALALNRYADPKLVAELRAVVMKGPAK